MTDLALLETLNPAQRTAVESGDGPILVSAGPGSGKTRVLTHRVAYLIAARGIPPYNIMAVTFTNKAAKEMKQRLEQLIGRHSQALTIGTFHAICARILRREAQYIGLASTFVIFDSNDQLDLVKQALRELKLDDKMYPPTALLHAISRAKDELITPDRYEAPTYWHEVAGRVYKRYQEMLAANDAVDFDDLLVTTVRLLRDHEEVRQRYQRRYVHVLVDEFQDTNTAQYELVKLFAGGYKNLFVVGDPDQSIYGWRGANIRNIRSFGRDYPQAQTVLLEQNYRSTQDILDAAYHVIAHNPGRQDKRLWTENKARLPLTVSEVYDETEESEFVVREITRLVEERSCRLGDCAVMYRTNAQSRVIEDAFVRHHLPYKLVGATRFYARREIKDVLAYLRLIHNPNDNVSLRRVINVPPRRIGSKTIASLETWSTRLGLPMGTVLQALITGQETPGVSLAKLEEEFGPLARKALASFWELVGALREALAQRDLLGLLDATLEQTGYADYVRDGTEEGEERWRNIMELRSVAQEYAGAEATDALSAFLEEVALVSDVDDLTEESDAVTLLTLHAAKGLEFATVFMVGMEEGILPHSRSLEEPEGMEEERRLCYVGITRAKRRLYLTYAFRRTIYGSQSLTEPSRFLADIPDNLVKGRKDKPGRPSLAQAAAPWPSPSPSARRPSLLERFPQRGPRNGEPEPERPASPAPRRGERPLPSSAPGSRAAPRGAEPQFQAGDKVHHAKFGDGVVVDSQVNGGDEIVTIAFAGLGVKRLAASFAQLKKLP